MMYVFKHSEIKCCDNCPIMADESCYCNVTNVHIDDPYEQGPGDDTCPLMVTGVPSKIKRGDD